MVRGGVHGWHHTRRSTPVSILSVRKDSSRLAVQVRPEGERIRTDVGSFHCIVPLLEYACDASSEVLVFLLLVLRTCQASSLQIPVRFTS